MGKKEALKEFHKENILCAAERLFEERGFRETTMDEIALAADYSKATIYVYFKSKDEIFNCLVYQAMRMLLEKIESAKNSSDNAVAQYKAICTQLSSFNERHPFYYQSLMQTIQTDSESRTKFTVLGDIYQAGEQINKVIEDVIRNGIRQGFFQEDVQCLPTGFLYWGALSGIIQLADCKAEYIGQNMGMDKNTFYEFCFSMLLKMVLKEGVSYDG